MHRISSCQDRSSRRGSTTTTATQSLTHTRASGPARVGHRVRRAGLERAWLRRSALAVADGTGRGLSQRRPKRKGIGMPPQQQTPWTRWWGVSRATACQQAAKRTMVGNADPKSPRSSSERRTACEQESPPWATRCAHPYPFRGESRTWYQATARSARRAALEVLIGPTPLGRARHPRLAAARSPPRRPRQPPADSRTCCTCCTSSLRGTAPPAPSSRDCRTAGRARRALVGSPARRPAISHRCPPADARRAGRDACRPTTVQPPTKRWTSGAGRSTRRWLREISSLLARSRT